MTTIIIIILKARAGQKYPGWVRVLVINGEPGVDLSSWFGITMLPKSFQSGHYSQIRSVCSHTNLGNHIYMQYLIHFYYTMLCCGYSI